MDGSNHLHQATEDARDVLAALREALVYSADKQIEDVELRQDTIEGETDVFEMIDRSIQEVALAKGQIEGLAGIIANMQARKRRLTERIASIRTALAVTMEVIEETKLSRPMATVSLPKARAGLEIDPDREHELPDEFLEVVQPEPVVKILTDDIVAALKDGREIPGCVLVDLPRCISIRTK